MSSTVFREELFNTLCNNSPIGIYIVQDGSFRFVNPKYCIMTGFSEKELLKMNSLMLVHPHDTDTVRKQAVQMLKGRRTEPYEFRFIRKSGEIIWVIETVTSIQFGGKRAALGNFMDVTERKRAEKDLRESQERYRTIFENTGTAILIVREDTIISLINTEFEKLTGYSKEEVEGKISWTDLVQSDYLDRMRECRYRRRIETESVPGNYESKILDRNGNVMDVILTVSMLPCSKKSVVSLLNITERKKIEEQLKYLSLHDSVTGLYNRAYFEEEMRRLEGGRSPELGIIVCDVDGLKLVNDSLGHDSGDTLLIAAASVIKESLRTSDMAARIGGDEFAILLPNSNTSVVENVTKRIRDSILKYNEVNPQLPLSISIGFAVGREMPPNLTDLFKEADNNMYREKLNRSQSARSAIVQTLLKALEVRDYITEGHADRLQSLVVYAAREIGLSERVVTDLSLLAQFHDIGKVGIPDRILFKPGPLDTEEKVEMQQHCKIGHIIAMSPPDMIPIADWILKHHEWWNGQGYPMGLKGEEIPLECRILAIADAYDAMTSNRPYRKALSHQEAVAEITRCAGTQFDPNLVPIFLKVLENKLYQKK